MLDPEVTIVDIVRAIAEVARRAWEPAWPIWKLVGGYRGVSPTPSTDSCIPSSFALRDALIRAVPEYRWSVAGGRPTKRTTLGGYLDRSGAPRPHFWVEGRGALERLVVDVTADQFGGPPVVVATGAETKDYTANATRGLKKSYEAHEKPAIEWLLEVLDVEMRRTEACSLKAAS